MSLPLSVIALGGGLVGLRMVRGPLLKKAFHRLSRGEGQKLSFPPSVAFELPGRIEDLPVREPSLSVAFTFRSLLVRRDAPGKVAVFELTSGIRRVRRLLAVRPKGPNLSIVAIPSPSDLINLATMAVIVAAIGFLSGAGWPYWVGMSALLAVDAWLRLRIDAGAVRRQLERLLAPPA
jgi:hypothetical protein